MVEKITQPITPLEQIEKINEIVECVSEFNGKGVDKNTTNGILIKQISEKHNPIIENNNGTIVLKAGSKLYVGGNLGTLTIEEDLDISNVGDLPQGTKDYAIVLFQYNSDYYDSVGGVPVEVLGKTPHASYLVTVSYELDIPTPNYKPMLSSSSYSATLPICIVRTGGTVEPYIKDVYQIGNACLVFEDSLKVSIPNGRNSDGTLNNLIVSSADSILTNISGTDKIYIDSAGTLQKSSNCEYNQKENYNKVDGSNVLYAKIGDISSIDDVIQVATKEDLKSVINYNNISNCITHIPQDIKLEFNNGTLTLKAGSKIYVPNDFEEDGTTPHFNEVITENDISVTGNTNRTTVLFLTADGNNLERYNITYCQSGSTYNTDTTYIMWYDTTHNLVKKSSNSGSSWTSGVSLPIAVCTETSTGFTSVDQVFNGFGFMGSTVFALPGVKFLVSNGKNPDGTLQNIESTLTKHTTSTIGTDFKNRPYQPIWFALNAKTVAPKGFTFSFDNYSNTDYEIVYDAKLNKHFYRSTGQYEELQGCLIGFGSIDANSKFTTLKSKTVFHALDFNDKLTIVGWGRQFTAVDKVVASGNAGIAGTYYLGFTDSNVKIGVFSAAIQTGNSGYSDMEIASDVLPAGVKVCGTNNSFKSAGCITIPFKRTITISFPNTFGGVTSGTMVNFEGYM